MGATAALIGRATGREAQATMRAADQEIAQLQCAAPPALPAAAMAQSPSSSQYPFRANSGTG